MTGISAYPRLRQAEKAIEEGRLEMASAIVIQHLRENRNEPRGVALLGSIAFKMGALVQAEQFLRQAIAVGGSSLEVQRELASVMHHQERLPEALSALSVLQDQTPDVGLRGAKALILDKLGRNAEAIREHEDLVAKHPDHPRVWLGYGNSLRWAGRNEEAIAAYRRATAIDPEHGDVWWALANIKTKVLTDEDIEIMKSALKLAIDERNVIPLHFALGRALHDRKEYQGAFEHFETGNRLRAETINYVPEDLSAEVDEIGRLFDREFFERRERPAPRDEPTPVFLISLPRAGSTLLEQMLDQHPDIEAVGELPYVRALVRSALEIHTRRRPTTVPQMVLAMSPQEARAYGQDYMHRASLHWTGRPRYFVDKMPMNWSEVPFIWRILPQARFIEIRRNAMDCCVSNYMHYFSRAHSSSFSLRHIGCAYLDMVRMMDHLNSVAPRLVHSIRYEELIESPEPILRGALDYLGLEWDPALLKFYESDRIVRTPSVEQVQQPLNRKGIGTWTPYAEWLGPLRDALGSLADA
ncbi:tetratricopeptide repeat-containing sulfotransferase family protein [Sphingomonas sp. URHD0057]|uniref:tetratricopeptide repeat-containing sulfotransferase family protein n=1 Tax=Sphingomonas sp. URHD0057 TaxID=1380389 RepID=UPI0006855575|nr:sulfotransferase [Sphingomonas sp. URHD0057]